MPIRPYEPPAESIAALREAMKVTPKAYRHNAEMMKEVLADVSKHWPHPVYRTGLKDMITTNGLRKAEIIGWRYLARSGSDRNYAIEVQIEDDARLRLTLQSCRDVRRVTNGGVVHPKVVADGSDDNHAAVHAHPKAESNFLCAGVCRHRLPDRKRGKHRAARMIFMRDRSTE